MEILGEDDRVSGGSKRYDPMGRISQEYQRTPVDNGSGAFSLTYTYDYLGDILTATNGEGVTFSYSYDTAANLLSASSSLSDANHPGTLLTVLTRNAMGQMATGTLGNGIALSRSYTNRGFLQSLTDGSVYTANPLSYAANGDILGATDSINGTWTFSYDDFDRVATAGKTGDAYTYAYDRFGNRWQQNGGIRQSSLSFDQYNHIAAGNGVTYDAAGNVTNDGFHSYTYDAENRIVTVDGTYAYVYDADGQRMRQGTPSGTYDYLYDLQGRVVSAVSSANQWVRGEIYAGPAHLATYASGTTGTTYFDHRDWLGTVRVRTGPTGTMVQTCTTEWFGEQNCSGTDGSPLHFTGHELDNESNLNHFLYRQYSSAQGRWVTPDPAGLGAVAPGAPQTWNRYAYVANSPMNAVDPLGLDISWNCPFDPACDSGPGIGDGAGSLGRFSSLILRAILQELIANALQEQAAATATISGRRVGSESLGLPKGMKLPQPTLASIILPGNMQCDFGVCAPVGGLFRQRPVPKIDWSKAWWLNPVVQRAIIQSVLRFIRSRSASDRGSVFPAKARVQFKRSPTWGETAHAYWDCIWSDAPTPELGKEEQPSDSSDFPETPSQKVNNYGGAAGLWSGFAGCVNYHLGVIWWP